MSKHASFEWDKKNWASLFQYTILFQSEGLKTTENQEEWLQKRF